MANSHQSKLVKRIQRWCPQVNRVADSTKPATVKVTRWDTRKADKKNPESCAMACAYKRQGWDAAIIHRSTAYLVKGDLAVRFEVPESVAREIVSFDRHGDFQPGEYGLSAVVPARRLGADRRPSNRGRGPRDSRKRPVAVLHRHRTEGIR